MDLSIDTADDSLCIVEDQSFVSDADVAAPFRSPTSSPPPVLTYNISDICCAKLGATFSTDVHYWKEREETFVVFIVYTIVVFYTN